MIAWTNLDDEPHGASVPDGELVYAFGDVHGRADLLAELLDAVVRDGEAGAGHERRSLVFLGDYVDRGPDSRAVIEALLTRIPEGFERIALKGNHEDFLLQFLANPSILPLWLMNGAAVTLASYGARLGAMVRDRAPAPEIAQALAAALPANHLAFLQGLRLSYAAGCYFFAHAGIRPGIPLDRQSPQDLMWIREPFLASARDFGKIVVHGHTPARDPDVRSNRIGIDTGAWTSGRLTALKLDGARRAIVSTQPD